MSLRARFAILCSAVIALALLLAAVAIYVDVRAGLRRQVENALRSSANQVLHSPGGQGPGHGGDGPGPQPPTPDDEHTPPPLPDLSQRTHGSPFGGPTDYVQFVSPAGTVSRPGDETTALPVPAADRTIARNGSGSRVWDTHVKGAHLLVVTEGSYAGALEVARPLADADSALRQVLIALIVASVSAIVLAALLARVLARRALRPIDRFTRRAEQVSRDADVSERMDESGTTELRNLARTFNATLDDLERSVQAQRHLVADASHELRTPLASVRANVQLLDDAHLLPPDEVARIRADIVSEVDELTRLVGDVVELARGAAPTASDGDVELDAIVRECAAAAERRADRDVAVELALEPTIARGDEPRIARAVTNLIDNARKWSPPGSRVEVTLADGVLTVRDHGPGFTAEDLPHVFERFYRSDDARGTRGSGLGLAIVRQTAESHGGGVEASNADGGGALVRAWFTPRDELASFD